MAKIKNVILLPLVVFLLIAFSAGCDQITNLFTKKNVMMGPPDVVELKSGQILIGKILKESQNSIFVKYANDSIEVWVPRNKIKKIRKSTLKDLQAVEAEKQEWNKEKTKIVVEELTKEKAKQQQLQKEVTAARASMQKVDAQLQKGKNIEDAIRRGQVVSGMTPADVIDAKGIPEGKTVDRKEEIWKYKSGTVRFYDGKTQ